MSILAVNCSDVQFIFRIIHYIINILRWAVVIILLVMVTMDFLKGMMGKSDDEMRKHSSTAVKRVIWAVVVFFIPLLIKTLFAKAGINGGNGLVGPLDWVKCYNSAIK
jgi:hypothetical protein